MGNLGKGFNNSRIRKFKEREINITGTK